MQKVKKRDVRPSVQTMLWGKAAGRCEFDGCNRLLWKSPVTQETVNVAEKAHIYAFRSRGPRGNEGIDAADLNQIENLMLVCHDCHRTIDKTLKDGGRYPVELLLAWKREHEERIELSTALGPDKRSHVLLYGANIGEHSSPLRYDDAARAMFPVRYPAEDRAIELGMRNSATRDHDAAYWRLEGQNLVALFEKRVRFPLSDGLVHHLSVFALAPQPLLMLLGSLLIDIAPTDVYQRRREPPTWAWGESEDPWELRVQEPNDVTGAPALVLSLSATINDERVHAVDPNFSIWRVTLDEPHNNVLQTPSQLRSFRRTMRTVLDQIKARHGEQLPLSVFPVMPAGCAVELGRVRMPKADLRWQVYDQIPGVGFEPALDIPFSTRDPQANSASNDERRLG